MSTSASFASGQSQSEERAVNSTSSEALSIANLIPGVPASAVTSTRRTRRAASADTPVGPSAR